MYVQKLNRTFFTLKSQIRPRCSNYGLNRKENERKILRRKFFLLTYKSLRHVEVKMDRITYGVIWQIILLLRARYIFDGHSLASDTLER